MQPLFDEELEKCVLGAMLRGEKDLAEGFDLLREDDFYLDSNRKIFRSMHLVAAEHHACDLLLLESWFKQQQMLESVGGYAYLLGLDERAIRGTIKPFRSRLREMARKRALQLALTSSLERLRSSDYATLADELQEHLAAIADEGDELVSAQHAADRVAESLTADSATSTFATGIALLDIRTGGGLRAGRLWVDGALPARGKSSLGRQIASRNASRGVPTLVFSIEMSVEEWFGIDAANVAGVEAWKLQEPQYLNATAKDGLRDALVGMSNWPIWFDDASQQSIGKMLARARLAVLRYGVQLIVVDYLQRVDGGGKDDLRTRIGRVAQKLAEFAKRYRVAVLLLSQLKRPGDINERPTMTTLKESGDIEAHAHVIVLNYRPVDRQTEEFTGEDELIVAKNRFGKPGTVPVRYNPSRMEFEERVEGAY